MATPPAVAANELKCAEPLFTDIEVEILYFTLWFKSDKASKESRKYMKTDTERS